MSGLLEVIALHAADAERAEAGGADRVELCGSLDDGGMSPEPALVEKVRAATPAQPRVMVRLRAGFGTDRGEAGHGGGLSTDGEIMVSGFECLGACDMAPMASVNERYFGPLENADAKTIVDQLHEGAEVLPEKSLADRHLPGGDSDPGGEKVTGLKGPNQ